jgi:uncharacterized lipoprotein YehR (DUF1307 family)
VLNKVLSVMFVFLFVIILSGCGSDVPKNEEETKTQKKTYNDSVESLLDCFCFLLENKSALEDFISLFPKEQKQTIEEGQLNGGSHSFSDFFQLNANI